ncbi:MAG: SIMPL domain-containing protein [Candidatus Eisenbacteria bacterium]
MKTHHVAVLGISVVAAAFLLGVFFYAARVPDDVISVVGAATKRLESDVVKWRITLRRSIGPDELSMGYRMIQDDLEFLKGMLHDNGVADEDITVQPATAQQRHDRYGVLSSYDVNQGIFVISKDIDTVEKLALNPVGITDTGVIIEASNLQYLYSGLDEMKIELLAAATENARLRAGEITRNSGASLGKVKHLRSGVFQIREPFSTEVRDYGMYSTQTRQKEITVTVSAAYRIN